MWIQSSISWESKVCFTLTKWQRMWSHCGLYEPDPLILKRRIAVWLGQSHQSHMPHRRSRCSWFLWGVIEVTGRRKALTKNEQSERERETQREREQCWAMDISWFSTWVRVNKLSPKISMIYHQTYSNMKTYTGCSTPCLTQMMAALTSSCGIQRLRLCWGIGALERLHQRSHAECSDGGMRSSSGIQFEHKMKHEKYPGWMALIGSYMYHLGHWGLWTNPNP